MSQWRQAAPEQGFVNGRKTDLTRAKVGDVRRLVLEEYDNYSEKLDERVISDSLELEVPLLHASGLPLVES